MIEGDGKYGDLGLLVDLTDDINLSSTPKESLTIPELEPTTLYRTFVNSPIDLDLLGLESILQNRMAPASLGAIQKKTQGLKLDASMKENDPRSTQSSDPLMTAGTQENEEVEEEEEEIVEFESSPRPTALEELEELLGMA
ncbi:hypothetical protein PAAG_03808 [Paracoccidioides lutzii Pb01]|uniref:Uncharacterized protein n=1 Tax=Paracoccidioides lutzii (strain ATCC MYA-826 / Pb01) TaxID=502779 RepID=C1GZ64_PARBA|nr:hypothetical protein PAAG_03808 [Paracoccidioides lutzii Pb01]EEH41887.2 hypothetical protein PAAG_03808 [Paracoccidioides lutzii Pb01]